MKLSDFDYEFSKDLIAQFPSPQRDNSRLMVLKKATGEIEEKGFSQVGEYLEKGDVLVLNDTRVMPARLIGKKETTGGKVELLLLERLSQRRWKTLVRPKRTKVGTRINFDHGSLEAAIIDCGQAGVREVTFKFRGNFMDILRSLGKLPLPPYIKRSPAPDDAENYQTVYAKKDGAIACPTAGLHFTKDLFAGLLAKGVEIAYLTLHINYATFKPVVSNDITQHRMYSEYFELSKESAKIINQAKGRRRVVAVGTSSCRVLEHVASKVRWSVAGVRSRYEVEPMKGWTNLFIYPPYKFKIVDALITNFHLPKTTLLMLVGAFCGRKLLFDAYQKAKEKRYRFFSYGDAMFII